MSLSFDLVTRCSLTTMTSTSTNNNNNHLKVNDTSHDVVTRCSLTTTATPSNDNNNSTDLRPRHSLLALDDVSVDGQQQRQQQVS